MILGVGTDIANIERINKTLIEYGDKFAEKYFSEEEIFRAATKKNEIAYIAHYTKRWAAKEAFVKALGSGFSSGIYLKDIAIINDIHGKPYIRVENGAKAAFEKIIPNGYFAKIHLSISDDYPTVIAFVVIDAQKL